MMHDMMGLVQQTIPKICFQGTVDGGEPGHSLRVLLGNFLFSNTSNFLYFKIFVWFLFALFASFVIQMLSEKKKIVCRFNLDKEKAKVVLYILTSMVPR